MIETKKLTLIEQAIAVMLNANVMLNAVSDDASVSNSLARYARLDAIALSEMIQLLKSTITNQPEIKEQS